MARPSEPVDVRADRTVQGAVTVIVLAAFVFHQPLVIPVVAVFLGIGAWFGPSGNGLHRVFAALVEPRLSPAVAVVPAATVQAQDLLGAALLGVATLCILVGLGGLGSIVTLAEAGAAVVAATTGVHLGQIAVDRLRHRRK
jgi:hypothetical protein